MRVISSGSILRVSMSQVRLNSTHSSLKYTQLGEGGGGSKIGKLTKQKKLRKKGNNYDASHLSAELNT